MARSIVFSVSVGTGCYRHIQISVDATLYDLHKAILDAFDFDDDHMHAFFMNNRAWDRYESYVCPGADLDEALGYSTDVALSEFYFTKGYKFLYIFDFGDDWRFQVKPLRYVNEPVKYPTVLKSIGQVSQYGDDYEDDYEDDDDGE